MTHDITVVGAGLAGSEAAWQLANMGLKVRLIEMKPEKMTPAHQSDLFGELVCSNSLRGDSLANAIGLLKEELQTFEQSDSALCGGKPRGSRGRIGSGSGGVCRCHHKGAGGA